VLILAGGLSGFVGRLLRGRARNEAQERRARRVVGCEKEVRDDSKAMNRFDKDAC
jgi:hypothetical protein